MANPWNTTSSMKKEPELMQIISEELSLRTRRLQLNDDFVWVNEQELQQQIQQEDATNIIKSSIAQDVGKIVQPEDSVNMKTGDKAEKMYYDEDSDKYETDEEEELENVDDFECKMDTLRPVSMSKMIYPLPQWLKQREHGTSRIYSSANKNQKNNKLNPLLPGIKFDPSTTAVLEKLINNRYLGQYNEVIGRGKNSVVFHAYCHRRNCMTITVYNAVKVYKLTGKKETDKLVFQRVQREFEHLSIVQHHCSNTTYIKPIRGWKNVIAMSFIGFAHTIASSIQDLSPDKDRDEHLYLAIVSLMHKCYNVMHLVHGKLCAQNIRYWFEHPHLIGWGHSVKTNHPLALLKLMKDCKFVTEFYAQRGVRMNSTEELFMEITGCSKISSKLLEVIQCRDLYEIYDQNPNRRSFSPKKLNNNLRFKCN